jgi:hypothetical protein
VRGNEQVDAEPDSDVRQLYIQACGPDQQPLPPSTSLGRGLILVHSTVTPQPDIAPLDRGFQDWAEVTGVARVG